MPRIPTNMCNRTNRFTLFLSQKRNTLELSLGVYFLVCPFVDEPLYLERPSEAWAPERRIQSYRFGREFSTCIFTSVRGRNSTVSDEPVHREIPLEKKRTNVAFFNKFYDVVPHTSPCLTLGICPKKHVMLAGVAS